MVNRLKPAHVTVADGHSSRMNKLKIVSIAGGVVLLGLGGLLAQTNPDQAAYEAFATQAATDYLQHEGCTKAPFGLEDECRSALKSNQAQIRKVIANGTERHNFGLFSLYTTDLSLSSLVPFLGPLLPSYHVESIGGLGKFVIYKTQKH